MSSIVDRDPRPTKSTLPDSLARFSAHISWWVWSVADGRVTLYRCATDKVAHELETELKGDARVVGRSLWQQNQFNVTRAMGARGWVVVSVRDAEEDISTVPLTPAEAAGLAAEARRFAGGEG